MQFCEVVIAALQDICVRRSGQSNSNTAEDVRVLEGFARRKI
jgi:hypothetical protein